ncbi:MAG: DUF4249 family protein [Saprospiraceae bacterium]|nr:DUF4249 family protein [Saprospiraceae bacterium]
MTFVKISIFSLLTSLLLASCNFDSFDQVVDVDIPEHVRQLAITSQINATASNMVVFVTSSRGINDNSSFNFTDSRIDTIFYDPLDSTNYYISDFGTYQYDTIPGAVVKLLRDGNDYINFEKTYGGFYAARNITPLVNEGDGHTYTLKVEAPNFKTCISQQTIPSKAEIEELTYDENAIINENGTPLDKITLKLKDLSLEKNHYEITATLHVLQNTGSYTINDIPLDSNDPTVSFYNIPSEYGYYTNQMILNDASWNGRSYSLICFPLNPVYKSPGNFIEIKIKSINNDAYFYNLALSNNYNSGDNPFQEPTIVKGNFDNGFGIFNIFNASYANYYF